MLGYQQQGGGGDDGQASEPTPVPGTIQITNLGAEATVEKLEELFGSLGKIKVTYLFLYHCSVCVCVCVCVIMSLIDRQKNKPTQNNIGYN